MADPKEIIQLEKPYNFLKMINFSDKDNCWEWGGSVADNGYGVYVAKLNGKYEKHRAHRLAYFYLKGVLYVDLVVDHTCRNRKCCNPNHLRQVSTVINAIENSIGIGAMNKVKTHCIHGHELIDTNLKIDHRGNRACKACVNYSNKMGRERKKEVLK